MYLLNFSFCSPPWCDCEVVHFDCLKRQFLWLWWKIFLIIISDFVLHPFNLINQLLQDFTVEQGTINPPNGWKAYYAATKAIINLNAEFYNIIREGSLPAMSRFWLNADYVKCIHATGEFCTGYVLSWLHCDRFKVLIILWFLILLLCGPMVYLQVCPFDDSYVVDFKCKVFIWKGITNACTDLHVDLYLPRGVHLVVADLLLRLHRC